MQNFTFQFLQMKKMKLTDNELLVPGHRELGLETRTEAKLDLWKVWHDLSCFFFNSSKSLHHIVLETEAEVQMMFGSGEK